MTFVVEPEIDQAVVPTHMPPAIDTPAPRWSMLTRVAFRFFVIYASIYVLLTQMFYGLFGPVLGLLPFTVSPPGSAWSVRTAVSWAANSVLGLPAPLVIERSGSGDKPYDFAFAALLLTVSALLTVLWSAAARRRLAHPAVQKWFRLFLRFALGSTMLGYGMAKFFPLQMSFPSLSRMLTP